MAETIMLAFDVGTSGVKCSMITEKGQVIDAESGNYNTYYDNRGIAEQSPQDWWRNICIAMQKIAERNPEAMNSIAAIGVSGHMLGCVPVDKNGEPLCKAMIHSDSRAREEFEEVDKKVGAQRLYEMSGNVLDARSSLCKILWIKKNAPEVYAHTAKFLQSKDYIVSKLTGNIDTTDYSDACHAELIDIAAGCYDQSILSELGVSSGKLPNLYCGTDVVGKLTPEAARMLGIPSGIPVIAGGGDGACGSLGSGNVRSGDAYLNLGTTAWIAQVVETPVIDPHRRVFNIMNLDGKTCSLYGAIQSGGNSISWLQRLLSIADVKVINEIASEIAPGSDGLVFLPYLDGERSPVFDSQARGVFIGASQIHGPGHFSRAVFEGVAFALNSVLEVFRERVSINTLRAVGGGIHSMLWREIIADVCQIDIQILNVDAANATSLGVAAAAGVGIGVFKDLDHAIKHIQVKQTYKPQERIDAYLRNEKVYKTLYPALKEQMHRLSHGGS